MSKGTTATHRTGVAGTIGVSPPAAKATDIRVLIVDDSEDDALVTVRELKHGGYSPTFERVDTAEAMMSALGSSHWDVIVCDYIMPSFSGLAALEVFKACGLDLPFILVSGKVGEERAVEAMRAGATDYVMKDKLNRLVPAIKRELAEVESRRGYRKATQSLKQSEERYKALAENYADVVWVTNMNGRVTYVSPSVTRLLGYRVEELMVHDIDLTFAPLKASMKAASQALSAEQGPKADSVLDLAPVEEELIVHDIKLTPAPLRASTRAAAQPPGTGQGAKADSVLDMTPLELELRRKDGSTAWASVSFSFIPDSDGRPVETVAILHDITERKQAEEILRESEQRLKILFEFAPDAYYMNDMEGRFVDGNSAAERLTGYKREELIGRSLLEVDLLSAEQIPKAAATMERNQLGHPTGPDEFIFKRKDGSLVNVEVNTYPATINRQRLVLGAVRDITDRKRAEEALRISEEKYRGLVEHSNDLIYATDTKGVITYMGPQITRYGFTPEETVSRYFFDFVAPEDRERLALDYVRTIETGQQFPSEFRIVGRDGNRHWLEDFGKPFRDESGNVIGVSGVLRDVTDRKKAQAALREQEVKYSTLVNQARDAIGIIQDGRWVFVNPPGARMLGYAVEELTGKLFSDIVSAASFDTVVQAHSTRLAGIDNPPPYEATMRRKDGTIITVEISGSPIQYDGRPAVMAIARDITERKKANEELLESERRYRLLAENISDVIWVTDMNLRPVYTSPSIARLLGYSAEESMARRMEDSLTPASLEHAAETFTKILSLRESAAQDEFGTRPLELEFIRKDGTTIWTATTVSIMRDANGHSNAIMGVLHNITERKKTEETLRESEERLKILFECAPDVYCLSTLEGTILDANKAAFELFAYQKEEVLGKTFMELGVLPPEQFEKNNAVTLRGLNDPLEMVVNRKDGTKLTIEVKTFPVEIKGQTLLLSIARDISERKETLEAVRLSQEWFRNLVETTTDWVWESRGEGFYSYSNPQVRDILGFEPEEILGKTPAVLTFPEEADRIRNIFSLAAETGESVRTLEHVFLHKNGHPVSLETSAVPFFIPGQALPGYRGITRDITERQQAKNRLQQALNKLSRTMEGTVQSISRMVETKDPYTAGHQWRVTQLACAVAEEMGLADEAVEAVRIAGLLHDLGKIGIPSEILSKPGRLSNTEFAIIKTHAEIGYDILKTVDFPWPIADIVLQHHERLNGTGYPRGLHAEEISLEAKILAVADVVEAMSSHRPYRPTLGTEKALEEISKNSGTLYDSDAVYACLRLFSQKDFRFNEREI